MSSEKAAHRVASPDPSSVRTRSPPREAVVLTLPPRPPPKLSSERPSSGRPDLTSRNAGGGGGGEWPADSAQRRPVPNAPPSTSSRGGNGENWLSYLGKMATHIKGSAFYRSQKEDAHHKQRGAGKGSDTGGGRGASRPTSAVRAPAGGGSVAASGRPQTVPESVKSGRPHGSPRKKGSGLPSRLDWDPLHHDGPQLEEDIRILRETVTRAEQDAMLCEAKQRRLDEVIASKASKVEAALAAKAELDVGAGAFERVRSEETLLIKLKEQNRQLEKQLVAKTREIVQLSQQPKYTKFVNLSLENHVYECEISRLQRLVGEQIDNANFDARTRGIEEFRKQKARMEELVDRERRQSLQRVRAQATARHIKAENAKLRDEIAELEGRMGAVTYDQQATHQLKMCLRPAEFSFSGVDKDVS